MNKSIILKINDTYDFIKINNDNIIALSKGVSELKEFLKMLHEKEMIEVLQDIISSTELAVASSIQNERNRIIDNQYSKLKKVIQGMIIKELNNLQNELGKTNIEDFYIINNDGFNLTLAGSFDSCYYHEVEVIFSDVQFIFCPGTTFTVSKFRLAYNSEIDELSKYMNGYEKQGVVICLEDEFVESKYFIVANQVSVNWETVYYNDRQDLNSRE